MCKYISFLFLIKKARSRCFNKAIYLCIIKKQKKLLIKAASFLPGYFFITFTNCDAFSVAIRIRYTPKPNVEKSSFTFLFSKLFFNTLHHAIS